MHEAVRPDVTTSVGDDTASATATVDASAAEVFDFLRQPANHLTINGDGSVRGTISGPERLGAGDRFGMQMRLGDTHCVPRPRRPHLAARSPALARSHQRSGAAVADTVFPGHTTCSLRGLWPLARITTRAHQ